MKSQLRTTIVELIPWSRVLEKLIVTQLVKKSPTFHGTQRFITVFARALLWSLSWARSIQSTPSHTIFLRSSLILSSHHLGILCNCFPLGFPIKILYAFLISLMCAACPIYLIHLGLITLIISCETYKLLRSSSWTLLQPPVTSSLLGSYILRQSLFFF
jgi:hypothetical protein